MFFNLINKLLKKIRLTYKVNSFVHSSSKLESGTSFVNSTMDKHSFCGYDCDIYFSNIGSFVSIANSVVIGGGTHPLDWVSTSPAFYFGKDSITKKYSEFDRPKVKPVVIGNDVWIGRNSIIISGVNIGTGSCVGAGSVVTKDIPPYEIWAGNPARFIRKRFESNIVDMLIESSWWDYDDDKLTKRAKYIKNPINFLNND